MNAVLKEVCRTSSSAAASLVTMDGLCVASQSLTATSAVKTSDDAQRMATIARAAMRLRSAEDTVFQPSRFMSVSTAGLGDAMSSASQHHQQQVLPKSSSLDSLQSNNLAGFAENANLFALLTEEQFLSEVQGKTGFVSVTLESSERVLECRVVSGSGVLPFPAGPADGSGTTAVSPDGPLLQTELEISMFLVTLAA